MIIFLLLAQVDSLTLEQALDIALSQSPIYHESKVSLDKSRIQFCQSLSNLLPTLDATAQYTKHETNEPAAGAYSGKLTLTQPLFDLDIIGSIFAGSGQLRNSNLQHKADIAGLVLNVKSAYYNLIYARNLLESSDIAIKRAKENLKLIETKYSIGAASKLDKLQAEVFYLTALQNQAKAKTLQITFEEGLKAFLNTDNEIYPADSLIALLPSQLPPLDSLAAMLGKANYNIKIAQALKTIEKTNVVFSYLSFLPKVSLFYGYTYSAQDLVFDFQQWRDNSTKNYGISISLPIFEIKSLIFNNLTTRKELKQKELSEKQMILDTKASLNNTYSAWLEACEQLQFVSKSLETAAEAVALAKMQYTLGTISFLDLLTAEENEYDANVTRISALSNYYIQRANLSYLLGNLTLQ